MATPGPEPLANNGVKGLIVARQASGKGVTGSRLPWLNAGEDRVIGNGSTAGDPPQECDLIGVVISLPGNESYTRADRRI